MGTFYGARAALPVFRRQNSGHLIFVSSIVGRRGIPQMGGYTATKAAQAGLAESLRAEFAGTPIHVSCVYPGLDADRVHRRDGARLRPPRSRDSARSRRSTTWRRAIVACIRRPRPEVYPHRISRGLAVLNALAPRVHRSIRAQVRTPPRRQVAGRQRHDVSHAFVRDSRGRVPHGQRRRPGRRAAGARRRRRRVRDGGVSGDARRVRDVPRGDRPRRHHASGTSRRSPAADLPVVGVSWLDARGVLRAGARRAAIRERLPTEAEWERAARGGIDGRRVSVGRRRSRRGFPTADAVRCRARGR